MDSLHVAEQQPATAVNSAAVGRFLLSVPEQQLVVCTSDQLLLYQACEHQGLQLIDRLPLFDVFHAAVVIPASSASQPDLLLLLSFELAQVALVQLQPGAPSSPAPVTCNVLATASVPAPARGQHTSKSMYGVCISRPYATQGSWYLALSMYLDTVHVIRITPTQATTSSQPSSYTIEFAETALTKRLREEEEPADAPRGVPDAAMCQVGRLVAVLDVVLLPPWDHIGTLEGSIMLGVMVCHPGTSQLSTVDIHLLEVVVGGGLTVIQAATASASPKAASTQMKLLQGPVSLIGHDPSTRLMHRVPATQYFTAGMLTLGQLVVTHVSLTQDSEPGMYPYSSTPAMAIAQPETKAFGVTLPGVPTCVEVVHQGEQGKQVLLVADEMAGMTLLYWGYSEQLIFTPIITPSQPTIASSLRYLPLPSTTTQPATAAAAGHNSSSMEAGKDMTDSEHAVASITGVVFLGSRNGNSQLLGVPISANQPSTVVVPVTYNKQLSQDADPYADASVETEPLRLHVLDVALIKSLVPVSCCEVVMDAQEAGDATLMLGCGASSLGRLAKAKLGMAFVPYQPSSTTLPETAQLFPITSTLDTLDSLSGSVAPGSGTSTCTSHLAFTFSASNITYVLSLEGSVFRQVDIPGLRSDVASLLIKSLQDETLVQVTADEVRVLAAPPSSQLLSTWAPPAPAAGSHISHAAAEGSVVAVCTTTHLHTLGVSRAAAPALLSSFGTPQSASSLNLLPHPEGAGKLPVAVWGQWVDSKLVLAPADNLGQALLVVDMHGHTARSAALLPVPGNRWALAVGTNNGILLLWEMHFVNSDCWSVGPAWAVQTSNVAVQLSVVHEQGGNGVAAWPYLYAHSGQGAVIRVQPDLLRPLTSTAQSANTATDTPGLQALQLPEVLQVSRVHGSTWLAAACAIHTPGLSNSWVWITSSNQLMLGCLDAEVKLRWTSVITGETPHHIAYHEPTRCYVTCGEAGQGGQVMRLVHGTSLLPLLTMRLAADHVYTSLLVTPLPCSSETINSAVPACSPSAASSRLTRAAKQFIVLASQKLPPSTPPDDSPGPAAQPPGKAVGLLSFFELVVDRLHENDGTKISYKLLLHGTCPSPDIATALAVTTPSLVSPSAEAATGSSGTKQGSTRESAAAGTAAAAGQGAAQAAGSSQVEDMLLPYLIAGCQDGVRVYQVHVEDVAHQLPRDVQHVVEAVQEVPPEPSMANLPPGALRLAAAAEVEDVGQGPMAAVQHILAQLFGRGAGRHLMPQEGGGGGDDGDDDDDDSEDMEVAGQGFQGSPNQRHISARNTWLDPDSTSAYDGRGRAVSQLKQLMGRDWNQHVTLKTVTHVRTHAGHAVTQLRVKGSHVYASDFLASVTLLQLQLRPGKQQQPHTVELVPLSAVQLPIFTPAALPLTDNQLLVGVHPHGLALLRRDGQAETAAAVRAAARRRAAAAAPHSHGEPGAGQGDEDPAGLSLAHDWPDFDVCASCRVRHDIRFLLPVRLGLHFELLHRQPSAGPAAHTATSSAGQVTYVTGVASDGSVLGIKVVSDAGADKGTKALLAWQDLVHSRKPHLGLTQHVESWSLCVGPPADMNSILESGVDKQAGRQLPGGCVDLSLLSTGLKLGLGPAGGLAETLATLHV